MQPSPAHDPRKHPGGVGGGTKIQPQPSDRDPTASVSSPGPLIKSSKGTAEGPAAGSRLLGEAERRQRCRRRDENDHVVAESVSTRGRFGHFTFPLILLPIDPNPINRNRSGSLSMPTCHEFLPQPIATIMALGDLRLIGPTNPSLSAILHYLVQVIETLIRINNYWKIIIT